MVGGMTPDSVEKPFGLLTLPKALSMREIARQAEKRVVFTNGCFDIIHRGHVSLLQQASRLGDYLIVGLNSDESVRRLKGEGRPIVSQEDRAEVLASLRWVDGVVLFEEDTPRELIASLRPDILVKGGDYTVENVVGRDVVEGDGGEVVIIPYLPGYSTSAFIEAIGEMPDRRTNH
jgi:rfaE bifunctional protein nucleotidyltransferase chain/domain